LIALLAPLPKYVYGKTFSLRTTTPSRKNETHLTFLSLHPTGVVDTVASMSNEQVEKSDSWTTDVNSLATGGITDASRALNATILLEQLILPWTASTVTANRTAANIFNMINYGFTIICWKTQQICCCIQTLRYKRLRFVGFTVYHAGD
jgi:hypothetical protein